MFAPGAGVIVVHHANFVDIECDGFHVEMTIGGAVVAHGDCEQQVRSGGIQLAAKFSKKGDEVEAVVLSVDPERERISLGVKQLIADPYSNYLAEHAKGTIVIGKVAEVDAKGAKIDLAEGVEGYLRSSELARDRVEDARSILSVGDEIEAKFVGVDRKNRTILLSVKAKDSQEEADALRDYSKSGEAGATTLGDLLKEHIRGDKDEE